MVMVPDGEDVIDVQAALKKENADRIVAIRLSAAPRARERVIELARDTDIFIYDAQFTPEEYLGQTNGPPKVGWGHSTFVEGANLAKLANTSKLVLFHHDPAQDDDAVLEKEQRCRELFPATEVAWEGLVIELS